MFGARASAGSSRKLLTVADLQAGQNVLYKGRRASVVRLIEGHLRDGTTIPLAHIRFPRGGVQVVFANQLEEA